MKFFTIGTIVIDISEVMYESELFIVVQKNGEIYHYQEPTAILYELETMPEGIVAQKYCYDGEAFTLNPNWIDPDEEE